MMRPLTSIARALRPGSSLRTAAGALLLLAGAARAADYRLETPYPNFTFVFPTDIQPANDGSNRLFVAEKRGVISVFPADFFATQKQTFLDISFKVRSSGEAGLVGLAFDPKYKTNGFFYVFYVINYVGTDPLRTIVARYHVSADPNVADPNSELILIDNPQPGVYHNGGQLAFGPDGYLYIGMGDNMTPANAQDLTVLPGKILRIDVNVPPGPSPPPYLIPPDNPFAGNPNGWREETFAYGFRNPWRFSFDRVTHELWAADVGEDTYEELDLVRKGGDYGWPIMEGPACYLTQPCDSTGLEPPFYWYTHAEGAAVIGGYRGWSSRLPELAGEYIFSDYTGGTVWGLHYDGASPPERYDLVTGAPNLLTFGLSPSGDVLLASSDGNIYYLQRIVTAVRGAPPQATRLLGNFPNPFNPSTTIRYHLARPGRAAIEIVGVDGVRLERYDLGRQSAGDHELRWNGETRGGRAASGVYFCRLRVDGADAGTIRMVLVQ